MTYNQAWFDNVLVFHSAAIKKRKKKEGKKAISNAHSAWILPHYLLPLSKPVANTSHHCWPTGGLHQPVHDLQNETEREPGLC